MLLVLAFLPLALAAFLVGELATAPQRRRSLAIKRAGTYGARRGQAETVLPRFSERVVAPAVERLAAIALRLNPKASVDAIGTRLIAAGLAQRVSTSQFLAVKAGLALTGLGCGSVHKHTTTHTVRQSAPPTNGPGPPVPGTLEQAIRGQVFRPGQPRTQARGFGWLTSVTFLRSYERREIGGTPYDLKITLGRLTQR